jgi:hypothetical protein
VRVLGATTANDGHFGPLLPFARACAEQGHEVRVAAPESYGAALARAGLAHEPFSDAPRELIDPIMARLPTMTVQEADDVVVRDVFGRVDAQAALPGLLETMARWRPDLVLRESAELGSLAAAERTGVPHVQVSIGMLEVVSHLAGAVAGPLAELGRLAGLPDDRLPAALAAEAVLSLVPESLDDPWGRTSPGAALVRRFHDPPRAIGDATRPLDWGAPDLPLVYVTFGSVAGSLPPFAGVFREALDALAELEACILMTVGRRVDPHGLEPVPSNARVLQWVPQDAVLVHAAAVLGHGGFGTTMGALAAGVPQVVAPLFSFDQAINGERVAAVGAGLTTGPPGRPGDGAVARAAALLPRLLDDGGFAASARRVATAIRELPPSRDAVPFLAGIAG